MDSVPRGEGATATLVVVRGVSGVGKSATALQWLRRIASGYPDGELFASLTQNGAPVAPEDVLGGFLRALGVPPDRVPDTAAERLGLFRTVTADRSMTVLLDDAVSAAQVRALLPTSPTSVVVATSRYPLAGLTVHGASMISVDPLDDGSALELLERHVGVDRIATERRPAQRLAALCAGMPIALCVAAALVVARPKRPVARLVDQMRDRGQLEVLSVAGDVSVRSMFDMSYHELSPAAAAAYRVVGLLPGSVVCPELIAAGAGVSVAQGRHTMAALVDASLVDEVDDEVGWCHDLVREHARIVAEAELDDTARTLALHRVVKWYTGVAQVAGQTVMPARRVVPHEFSTPVATPEGLVEQDGALGWLERYRADLVAAVRVAAQRGWSELAYLLGDALQPVFILHKHYADAVQVDELALDAAVAWGNPEAERSMRKRLARVYGALGEVDRAWEQTEQLVRIARDRGDQRGVASGLKGRAALYAQLGQHDQAVSSYQGALLLLRELHKHRGEGLLLIDLGSVLVDLGQIDDALTHLDHARSLLSTLDPPDEYNAARASTALARAHLAGSDPSAARDLVAAVLPIFEAHRAVSELVNAHQLLARACVHAGDEAAADHHRNVAEQLLSTPQHPGSDPGAASVD